MDSRIDEHARILVEQCLDVQAGDDVLIAASANADDLVVALHRHLGERGAHPIRISSVGTDRAKRAFMKAMDPDDYDSPSEAELALAEEVDCAIAIQAAANTHETSDVDPEKQAAYQQVFDPVRKEILEKRWVGTQHPTPADAQAAEMSTEAYREFVYDAVNKDWDAQREFQANLVDILEDASEVHIQAGDQTDVTMSVDGMHAINDHGEVNLPGGEVFTAPVPDSVNGEVYFDMPVHWQGRDIEGAAVVFEDGDVVEHSAEKNEDLLAAMLDTDDDASRVGELGFGMNRDIDQFTNNVLFDEKMGDTVHLALGSAYEETVGDDRGQNESALHMDMIVDVSDDSVVEVDGEVIQRNGTFAFEDEFEATDAVEASRY